MMNETPEAALRSRIADLEQQLKLADEGTSRLAQRCLELEKQLQTPAKIYYKFEGNNTSGSHKLNSAIAQAYYAKKQGLKGVTTETGAGQWGTALSMACAYLGLDCRVFMVKCSYEQKPFRREVMRTYGASVTPSPSMTTSRVPALTRMSPSTSWSLRVRVLVL